MIARIHQKNRKRFFWWSSTVGRILSNKRRRFKNRGQKFLSTQSVDDCTDKFTDMHIKIWIKQKAFFFVVSVMATDHLLLPSAGVCRFKSSGYSLSNTGWPTCIGRLESQVSFRKKNPNHRALLQKETYKDTAPYASSQLCKSYYLLQSAANNCLLKLQVSLPKEPMIIGLFCRKRPIKIRNHMLLRHPVKVTATSAENCQQTEKILVSYIYTYIYTYIYMGPLQPYI